MNSKFDIAKATMYRKKKNRKIFRRSKRMPTSNNSINSHIIDSINDDSNINKHNNNGSSNGAKKKVHGIVINIKVPKSVEALSTTPIPTTTITTIHTTTQTQAAALFNISDPELPLYINKCILTKLILCNFYRQSRCGQSCRASLAMDMGNMNMITEDHFAVASIQQLPEYVFNIVCCFAFLTYYFDEGDSILSLNATRSENKHDDDDNHNNSDDVLMNTMEDDDISDEDDDDDNISWFSRQSSGSLSDEDDPNHCFTLGDDDDEDEDEDDGGHAVEDENEDEEEYAGMYLSAAAHSTDLSPSASSSSGCSTVSLSHASVSVSVSVSKFTPTTNPGTTPSATKKAVTHTHTHNGNCVQRLSMSISAAVSSPHFNYQYRSHPHPHPHPHPRQNGHSHGHSAYTQCTADHLNLSRDWRTLFFGPLLYRETFPNSVFVCNIIIDKLVFGVGFAFFGFCDRKGSDHSYLKQLIADNNGLPDTLANCFVVYDNGEYNDWNETSANIFNVNDLRNHSINASPNSSSNSTSTPKQTQSHIKLVSRAGTKYSELRRVKAGTVYKQHNTLRSTENTLNAEDNINNKKESGPLSLSSSTTTTTTSKGRNFINDYHAIEEDESFLMKRKLRKRNKWNFYHQKNKKKQMSASAAAAAAAKQQQKKFGFEAKSNVIQVSIDFCNSKIVIHNLSTHQCLIVENIADYNAIRMAFVMRSTEITVVDQNWYHTSH